MEETAPYEAIDTFVAEKEIIIMLASVLGEETMKERVAKVICRQLMPHLKSK